MPSGGGSGMRSSAHEGRAESAGIDGVAERSIPVRVGTFSIVPVLSREEFDAIEFGAAFSGDRLRTIEPNIYPAKNKQ